MLTDKDVQLIRDSRKQIRGHREKPVIITGKQITGRNPITGEKIEADVDVPVNAVVTEVSVRTAVDRYLSEGIEVLTGDIIVDVNIEDTDFREDDVVSMTYDGSTYTVVAAARLGLGGYNRMEFIGRLTS